jgi:hypothetical protein
MVGLWLLVNFLLVSSIIGWSYFQRADGLMLETATIFSQLAVILILLNLNMYLIFLLIRKSKKRNVKLTLAKISRKLMKLHVPIAITATSFIILHIIFIVINIAWDFTNWKLTTGLITTFGLLATLFAGYRRSKKASGKRRRLHIMTAFLFFLLALIHIFSRL